MTTPVCSLFLVQSTIIVLSLFSSCLPPFYPATARFCFLLPGGKNKKERKKEKQDRQARPAPFPSGLEGEARKGGWGPPALQRSRSPFPGGSGRVAAGTRRRGSSAPAPTGAACAPPAAPGGGSGATLRRRTGGAPRGGRRLRGAGGAERRRDGWMDG